MQKVSRHISSFVSPTYVPAHAVKLPAPKKAANSAFAASTTDFGSVHQLEFCAEAAAIMVKRMRNLTIAILIFKRRVFFFNSDECP